MVWIDQSPALGGDYFILGSRLLAPNFPSVRVAPPTYIAIGTLILASSVDVVVAC
jgi:hypothetical protein